MVFDSFSETRVIIDEAFNEAYYKEKLSVDKPSLIIMVFFSVLWYYASLYFIVKYIIFSFG